MTAARIRRLTLTNFRSYRVAQIAVAAGPVVLVGPNGAGKTNLIEAISFLGPGRGLRRATLDEVAFQEGDGSWAVSADVDGALGLATLGTGIEAPAAGCGHDHAQMPHRSRAGRVGRGDGRPPARDLAGAGDGRGRGRAALQPRLEPEQVVGPLRGAVVHELDRFTASRRA